MMHFVMPSHALPYLNPKSKSNDKKVNSSDLKLHAVLQMSFWELHFICQKTVKSNQHSFWATHWYTSHIKIKKKMDQSINLELIRLNVLTCTKRSSKISDNKSTTDLFSSSIDWIQKLKERTASYLYSQDS